MSTHPSMPATGPLARRTLVAGAAGLALACCATWALGAHWMIEKFGLRPVRPIGEGPAAGVAPPRSQPSTPPLDLHILVDQFGYRPGDPKVAVIRSPRQGFDVARGAFTPGRRYELRELAGGNPVFAGTPQPWNQGRVQDSSGDVGWWFDFSSVVRPGRYYVYDVERARRSASFAIDPQVYEAPLRAVVRSYYYQRSATEKRAPYAEACWADGAAYVGDKQDRAARDVNRPQDPHSARDLAGGWFDAGDTNQYVTFATQAVHGLLAAYRDFPAGFGDDSGIPESGNGVPDLLDELRWETDWLKKMQNANGTSLLKLGVLEHGMASPPSSDRRPRFYVPACTSATIASAGMLAHASVVFGGIASLQAEARELRQRAVRGFDAFVAAPKLETDCDDLRVVSGDADRSAQEQKDQAVLAAVYLFAATGDTRFQDYVRAHYRKTMPYRDFGWSRYDPEIGDALLYFTTVAGADPALAAAIRADKLADAREGHEVYGPSDQDLYRNYLHREQYHWGSNGMRVAYANANLAMNRQGLDADKAPAYRARALETLHYLHGVNPFGIVYISNMYALGASYSVNAIFHQWYAPRTRWDNAVSSECGPPPGFLVGGPNAAADEGGVPRDLQPPRGQPPQKSYRDWNEAWPDASYALTEPSNTYQANYVRLLAALLGENRPTAAR